ncbi:MAG: hypothetical protein JNK14_11935 [Chitinophagaceae bacterium]|nr:hypothetical protein [Chitinophagaceae bacterium]
MIAVILSFIFFGRRQGLYHAILLVGLLLSLLSFLRILLADKTVKSKLIWTFIVIAAVVVQQMSEQILIRQSYRIFISKRHKALDKVNSIFESKDGDAVFTREPNGMSRSEFSPDELRYLDNFLKKARVRLIVKDEQKIFYITGGWVDIYHGVYFFYGAPPAGENYKRIKDRWYY